MDHEEVRQVLRIMAGVVMIVLVIYGLVVIVNDERE
jgi:succinate dehydrogenase hydrophobic anchor subunit